MGVRLIVLGGGGHAKVVISTARAAGHAVVGVYDDNPKAWGQSLFGVPVVGGVDKLADHAPAQAIIAIGNAKLRRELAERLKLDWFTLVHPRALVDASVKLGPGTVVFAGAIVQPDVTIGAHVILNTGSSVDHDCRIGDYVHISPGAHLAGGITIGDGTFIGPSCGITSGVKIGAGVTLRAGSGVWSDLPDNVTAAGSPARVE